VGGVHGARGRGLRWRIIYHPPRTPIPYDTAWGVWTSEGAAKLELADLLKQARPKRPNQVRVYETYDFATWVVVEETAPIFNEYGEVAP
jgi:hypothetical protein